VTGEEQVSATEAAQGSAIAQAVREAGRAQAGQTALEEGTFRGEAEETATPLEEAREVREVITGQALAPVAVAALQAWALEEVADAGAVVGADDRTFFVKSF